VAERWRQENFGRRNCANPRPRAAGDVRWVKGTGTDAAVGRRVRISANRELSEPPRRRADHPSDCCAVRQEPSTSGAIQAIANNFRPRMDHDGPTARKTLARVGTHSRRIRPYPDRPGTRRFRHLVPRDGCSRPATARAQTRAPPRAPAMARPMNLSSASGRRASSRWVAPIERFRNKYALRDRSRLIGSRVLAPCRTITTFKFSRTMSKSQV
jgi:hypothetical protein